MSSEETFQNLLETCLSLGGSLEGWNWCATKGRGASPALFWKLKKVPWFWRQKKCLTKFLSQYLNSMKPPLPWKNSAGTRVYKRKKWGCGEVLFGGREKCVWGRLWKSCGTFHVWRFYGNCWIHLGEYLVHAKLDSSQNCRNTLPLYTVDQLVIEKKKKQKRRRNERETK